MEKSEIIRMAEHLEKAAKDEECHFVTIREGNTFRQFSRYQLPYVAEGMRKEAYKL